MWSAYTSTLIIAASLLCLVSPSIAGDYPVLDGVTLPTNTGAMCLDGTPAMYYYRKGSGSGANKFQIYFEGGGWCYDLDDCLKRSSTALGSSSSYGSTTTNHDDLFSSDPTVNPLMYNWNLIFMPYCDGGSFSGRNITTTIYGGKALYWRGGFILDTMLANIKADLGFNSATDVVVSGCSAGGLATYMHADYIKSHAPVTARVVALPDSGFFLDFQNPQAAYESKMKWVFEQNNSTYGTNNACIKFWTELGEPWRCIFAEHISPFIDIPTFAIQSIYDSWQIPHVLGTDKSAVSKINVFGDLLTHRIYGNLLYKPQNGAFLSSCYFHCRPHVDIDGVSFPIAFSKFYNGEQSHFIQEKPFPCYDCCLSDLPEGFQSATS